MTSRRELYAHGEPFGDSATRAKLGGGYICGGGGDSSSSNTQTTTTNQYDMRSITDARTENTTTNNTDARSWTDNTRNTDSRSWTDTRDQSLTNSNNTTNNITTLDAGAIEAGKSVALAGISNNSTNTANLIAVADSLFSKTADALSMNTKLAQSLASGANQAYSDATSQATGNKNLVYAGMAVVGLVAVSMFMKKS